MARVGDDASGRLIASELAAVGVSCAFAVDPDAPTCVVVVLVDGSGQRSMLPDRGAMARFAPEDVDPAVLAGADHLLLREADAAERQSDWWLDALERI